eukprot:TRINITY_DN6997_c0_g1::TRINITY_DN6997_c0_g1_i1::g.13399::m.13399 TRINITY_DN6997_c0_g1::TRINITY_DN6997_c0_g1_i1::g.13399  ORF type:complete len:122 (+),score=-2.66,sp/Q1SF86/ATG12_MEDTR/51.06/1e-29,APG12/PF04110.8/1.6e-30 TRINITY_DN6997_c0_g1_i1:104-469(+)
MADRPVLTRQESGSLSPREGSASETPKSSSKDPIKDGKVMVHLRPVGNAPILRQNKFKIQASKPFSSIIDFLREELHAESVFVYINSAFAPGPDQMIAHLAQCFHTDGVLVLNYCQSQAYG